MSGTVIDALTYWSRTKPDLPAINFDGDVITYAELARWADGVAHDLAARGVKPGDRVGLVGANTLEWCAAALGALKVGAIVAPFNQRMLAGELTALVEDCEPTVVYCDEDLRSRLEEVRTAREGFSLAVFEQDVRPLRTAAHAGYRTPVVDLKDPTAIVFTSGTTGRPKGVIFTHASISGEMHEWSLMEPILPNGLRPLLVLPLFSAAGIIWGISGDAAGRNTFPAAQIRSGESTSGVVRGQGNHAHGAADPLRSDIQGPGVHGRGPESPDYGPRRRR